MQLANDCEFDLPALIGTAGTTMIESGPWSRSTPRPALSESYTPQRPDPRTRDRRPHPITGALWRPHRSDTQHITRSPTAFGWCVLDVVIARSTRAAARRELLDSRSDSACGSVRQWLSGVDGCF